MLIKKLPLGIPIDANIGIQTQYFAAPELVIFDTPDDLAQPSLGP